MEKAHLHGSMSKKGCLPDNSVGEGFFGRMQNKMYYGFSWVDISIEDVALAIENCMVWYREKWIKCSCGGMSPLKYLQNLGLWA